VVLGWALFLCVISWFQALSGTGQEPGQEFQGPEDPPGWGFGVGLGWVRACPVFMRNSGDFGVFLGVA
jgi:hypothetical protein